MNSIETTGGVDTGKLHLDLHVLPQGDSFQVENNPNGIRQALRRLKALAVAAR